MNIFILETDRDGRVDWERSARSLDNLRLGKMTVETAQILCTALFLLKASQPSDGLYRPTHQSHPCVKWAAESQSNFIHLLNYFMYLHREFLERSGKQHKSAALEKKIDEVFFRFCKTAPDSWNRKLTPLPMAVSEEFKLPSTASTRERVEAYRRFFASKPRISYDRRDVPYWFVELRKLPWQVRENRNDRYQTVTP